MCPSAIPEPATDQERMAQLVLEGHALPATRTLAGPPKAVALLSFEELMQGLTADREDR
jgi:hypothetical protein